MPVGALKVKVTGAYRQVSRGPRGPSGALTGEMKMWLGLDTAVPAGYLICIGQSLSTTTYADLFAVTGYKFGGSGANFNLPDMRVRVPVGAGTGKAFGASDSIAEASRNANRSHSHNHQTGTSYGRPGTTALSGALTVSGTVPALGSYGVANYACDAGSHEHLISNANLNQVNTTPTSGGAARLTGPADHAHNGVTYNGGGHSHSVATDIQHGHGAMNSSGGDHVHTITTDANTTVEDPFVVVNYIVKT